MNKQGKGKIDWTGWTWNPISGCLGVNGVPCEYCYMQGMRRFNPQVMEPHFHEGRLCDLRSRKLMPGDRIFVGSSGDMWGDWVPRWWITAVLETIGENPQYTYQFLTKNPGRYADFAFEGHEWLGTTDDGSERTADNVRILRETAVCNAYVSFEPLLWPVDPDLEGIDWVIIGANSLKGSVKPPKEWADHIIGKARGLGIPVFVKDNYKYPERVKEFPV